jgi:4a-hydroxytetrahydrobiopterin dehydratase
MKHIKTYKIFESLEGDVEDIFIELKDDGYSVEVDIRPQGLEMVTIDVSRDKLFNWLDVKDYFERALDAIDDNWKLSKIVLVYYPQSRGVMKSEKFSGSNLNYFRQFVSDPEFVENNMIFEIAFVLDKNEFKWIENNDKLQRKFEFKDFTQALAFINRLATICESMKHHPEINWVYNKIELTLSTHDAGNKITELDYQLANKIDEIPKFLNIICK